MLNNGALFVYRRGGESTLDYSFARYYNPRLGRFMSPDPANIGAVADNPQSWNGYSYALNDPGTLTDPLGACVSTVMWNPNTGAYVGGSQNQGGSYGVACSAPPPLENVSEEVATELLEWDIQLMSVLSQGPIPPTVYHSGHLTQMPTQPQTWSQRERCGAQALKKNAVALSLDAAGIGAGAPPGGDAVVALAQMGVSTGGVVNDLAHNDTTGAYLNTSSFVISALTPTTKAIGGDVAKLVPGLGAGVSAVAFLYDAYHTYEDYRACTTGVQ